MLYKHMRQARCTRAATQRGGIVAGCLIALGVVVLLVVIGGIILAMNWHSWAGSLLNKGMTMTVEQTSLSQPEQQQLLSVVDDFTDEFKNGDITFEQLTQVMQEITESPMLPAMVFMEIDESFVKNSALSDEEKAQGSKDLGRFVRGLFEGDISQTKIDDVAEPIHYTGGGSRPFSVHANNLNLELKNPKDVTPEELKAFLANAKAEADKAGIADEPLTIDYAKELRAAIDRALGRAPALESDKASESGG